MDAAHLHLLINHVPVLGTIFGLAALAYGLLRKQEAVVRLSLWVFVISGLMAVVAYLSGEGAEDLIENLADVSEAYLEPHEDAGFYALISAIVLGVFAAGSLAFFRTKLPRLLGMLVLVLALGVSGLMTWTANLGGQIRHPEIRPAASTSQAQYLTQPGRADAESDDHDDR